MEAIWAQDARLNASLPPTPQRRSNHQQKWHGIDYAGTQITQWDFQNKGKSGYWKADRTAEKDKFNAQYFG